MKMTAEAPKVRPDGWYNTADTVKLLGMSRSTLWRAAKEGKIKRRLRKADNKFWYQGKDILRFFNAFY